MKRSRFTQEQIIGILRRQGSVPAVLDLCRRHGQSSATFYKWKANDGSQGFALPFSLAMVGLLVLDDSAL